jgi:hypothetical protein
MKLTPRAKMLLVMACFLAPIVASVTAYVFFRPEPTANYGELLLPPESLTAHPLLAEDGTTFGFERLRDRWVLLASDIPECGGECAAKLHSMRQVRLALGRDASRVARVVVLDGPGELRGNALDAREDLQVVRPPAGTRLPPGPSRDPDHIYLVDPRGNVMMRWPARPDFRRMLKDLQTLLRASQIG